MRFAILIFAVLAAGCATSASPNFFNGRYYWAGDSNCVRMRALSSTRIMCIDKNGEEVGYRDAMTADELYMYQMDQAREQMYMEQMSQSFQQMGDQARETGFQALERSQQYQAPQVAPITPPGGYQTVCLKNGIYVNCRSNSPSGSTETTCLRNGNWVRCWE